MKDSHLFDAQERSWVELAQKNDLDAFNHLVLSYQDSAFSLASWMLNDDALAEDVVQTAFLAAYRHIRHFRGGSFRAWLLKITRNSCIDELQRRIRHPWQPLEPMNADDQPLENANWLVDRGPSPEELVIKQQVMGLSLSPEDMTALDSSTEGWAAGLQLAALALHASDPKRQSASGFVRSFTGSNSYILGYLVEEVLQR